MFISLVIAESIHNNTNITYIILHQLLLIVYLLPLRVKVNDK
jgi:hypothetical protein